MRKCAIAIILLCAGQSFAASFCDTPPTNNQALAGYVLNDYGLGANTFTLTQGVYSARADAGGGAYFSGSSMTVTNISFVTNFTKKFTLAFWHKFSTTNTIDVGIYKTSGDLSPIFVEHYNNGVIYYQVGTGYFTITNTSTDWSFIALVFNGTNAAGERIRGYYNDAAYSGSTTYTNVWFGGYPFIIGRVNATAPWRGSVADVLMSPVALNDEEIGLLYTNTSPTSYETNWHATFATKRDATIYRFDCYTPSSASAVPIAAYRTVHDLITGAYR